MAMTHVGIRDSNKALPADIRTAFEPRTYYQGLSRLSRNVDVVQQSRGGMHGLGDTCYDMNNDPFECAVGVGAGGTVDYLQSVDAPPVSVPYVPPAAGGGVDMAAILKIIQSGASTLVPIIAATSQGVLYKYDAKTGSMQVYSQPAGNQQNLPVGGGGAVGTINTPFGSASTSGINGTTLMMIAALGLVAVLAMKR
jgi:hypothetical protein